ncbi:MULTISPECIES: hypothetical protein [Pseudomonas]|jgi:hypothetical protein|uniref:Lipoprotein n=1 Tax=Pseudomonas spirodelae TaxID=3101751 RepID=A0ABU5PBA5_9PSED|nr:MULTISPECIES: hypothetical protein [unclassified Pseudomonas]MBU0809532.1 hypothetical protein [Gammaproteobacteria bacterium]MBU0881865.1 hypothetical protein [Gammaproteobacteria bacterium]MBU1860800.1 hypothetical protein [Gammaproteobacteria bacterium]MDD2159730.1 hypothetical protein [Pseudomonas sp. MIL19]MEA1606795.1 hypothetical protein [Pseudomonas sp. T5W1]
MIVWRALLAVSFLLLGGCLVTFKDPIPAHEAAPIPLLGEWSRKNEWGELQYLQITRAGSNVYKARTYVDSLDNLESAEEYGFTVAHHGRRWYLSAGLPKSMGANFAIAGFELTSDNELVIYNLDVDRILQEVEQGVLQGEVVEAAESDGVLISSPLEQVFGYLDDQANSDVFIEVARYQRAGD